MFMFPSCTIPGLFLIGATLMGTTVYHGTPQSAALTHPFNNAAPLCDRGVFMGINIRTGQYVWFDPWWMMKKGLIHSMQFLITGEKRSGKSALAKMLGSRIDAMQAVDENGQIVEMRQQFNDLKAEEAEPEYAKMVRDELRGKLMALATMQFNLFHPDMKLGDLAVLGTAVNLAETARGNELVDFQPFATQVATYKMLTHTREVIGLDALKRIVRSLSLEDVKEFYRADNKKMFTRYEQELKDNPDLLVQLHLNEDPPINITEEELRHDSALVGAYFERLDSEEFGGVLNGTMSPRELFKYNAVDLYWNGVPEKARSVIEAMLWTYHDTGLNNGDLELVPHTKFGDEEHKPIKTLMHARAKHSTSKTARGSHQLVWDATQYELDMTDVGEPGSELRSLAHGINLGYGGRVYFRQPPDDDLKHAIMKHGVGEEDATLFTKLPPHVAGLVIPDQPVTYFQTMVMPSEWTFLHTDGAVQRMTNRKIWTMDDINDRAKELQTSVGGVPLWVTE
jgi:hypothetical protein